MTKKKIYILTLAFFFLVSTTGLPMYYHYCEMMQKKSLNECDSCLNENDEMFSCCSKEIANNIIKITTEKPICCQEEFVYNKVDDEFVNIKTDVNYFTSSEILLQPIVLIPHTFDFSLEVSFYCDTSPPFLINPELYISNSVLLI
jgi:hypothetical protein